MLDFYIAPDFPSSLDSGILAKKLQLKKKKLILIMRSNRIKIAKKQKKTILVWALFSLTYKCKKDVSEPFDSPLCSSWQPASFDSPHI